MSQNIEYIQYVKEICFVPMLPSVQFSSVAQSCPTLCDPMNCSTLGLPVHHQLQGSLKLTSIESVMTSSHLILCRPLLLLPPIPPRIILTPALSHMSKSKSEVAQSCPTLCNPMDYLQSTRLLHPWNFPGKSTGVGYHRRNRKCFHISFLISHGTFMKEAGQI